ncbi:MAG TPA: lytic murein transglycosylase [Devosia sp.]|nr:lytic murein transglycosylase [Devosia sp.]
MAQIKFVKIMCVKFLFAALFGMLNSGAAIAQPVGTFSQFLQEFESKARQNGISSATYRQAMEGVEYDASIARRISGQPEFTTPIWEYIERRVSAGRISRGKSAMERNWTLFEAVGRHYGVDPFVLGAIWGIETDYGAVLSNTNLIKPILPSLAALVYQRRGRVALDEAELISALKLVQSGHSPGTLVGSWAGAMGHLQVNSSILLSKGTDGNGDGKVDVHNSLADALATSAVLLNSFGYKSGVDWGFEVTLPAGFDYSLASRNQMKPIGFFVDRGVARVAGRVFGDLDQEVFLYLPAGKDGPKFLMTPNYLVLKSYNFSDSYALAVAHLTDRLKGAGGFVSSWPTQTKFPNRAQRIAIQNRLAQLGFYQGEVDGRIGPITQEAYQRYQLENGLLADGFITLETFYQLGG